MKATRRDLSEAVGTVSISVFEFAEDKVSAEFDKLGVYKRLPVGAEQFMNTRSTMTKNTAD